MGVDIINDVDAQCDKYKVMIIPALYSAPDGLLSRIHAWVERGGRAVISFKSGFSDENVKVRSTPQPGGLRDVCGVTYNQFTSPGFPCK
uniref:Glyco_hydro_42M n=1 Tax=uncultured Pectobacterium sp. TaxID=228954 RepID=A0A060C4C4_9GAMM|nr:Glyco_hydro_42M [uncultured Pectobacterium sp.]